MIKSDPLTYSLHTFTDGLKHAGLHRKRKIHDKDAKYVHFSSNDYLSLTSHPRIQKIYQEAYQTFPVGSGGSMVVSGYHRAHHALERAFAEALSVDDCLLFSSGYAANLSVMQMLGQCAVPVLIDKGVHASLYDGIALAQVHYSRYRHVDMVHLEGVLKKSQGACVGITESIFSMSGQRAPLNEMAKLCKQYESKLLVDEAHAFGVVGTQGLGAVAEAGLTQNEVPLRVIPFGKAFAGSGALVAGSGAWVDALLQSARSYIYSTAISPASAHALLGTLDVVRSSDDRRAKLMALVSYFQERVARSSLPWRVSSTPIQQLKLGCPKRALAIEQALLQRSIVCLPMRYPTVSRQETGLRVILNHCHEPETIDRLFEALEQLCL